MKMIIKIIFLLCLINAGCSTTSVSLNENQINKGMKSILGKTPEEQKIQISVPIYKF